MCASYESKFSIRQLVDAFAHAGVEIGMAGTGLPNLEPRDEVRPTDTDRVLRALPGAETAELIPMRFGFPPPRPKAGPVINFRSEGRTFGNGPRGGRCLVPVSGFYEFTGDRYPKTRWVLRGVDQPFLALAAVWRAGPDGEAFSLLTAEPGPDVAPYHTRGVIPLPPAAWADWLLDRRPSTDLLTPPPAGTLTAEIKPRG